MINLRTVMIMVKMKIMMTAMLDGLLKILKKIMVNMKNCLQQNTPR